MNYQVMFFGLERQAMFIRDELRRIEGKLLEYLPVEETEEAIAQMYDLTREIDEDIAVLLQDPVVRRLYEYDGQFFTLRGTNQFHTAFSGLYLLRSLEDSMIDAYFRARKRDFAIRWLLEELSKHGWVAKRRRLNWEESQTIGLIPKEVLDEIFAMHERRMRAQQGPAPLSEEERAFFKSFEDALSVPEPFRIIPPKAA